MVATTFVWVAVGIQYFNLNQGTTLHNRFDDKIDQIGLDEEDGPIEKF
ncbi:MAG: hypothetical protein AAF206_21810 [Bacteroidota bacterium]